MLQCKAQSTKLIGIGGFQSHLYRLYMSENMLPDISKKVKFAKHKKILKDTKKGKKLSTLNKTKNDFKPKQDGKKKYKTSKKSASYGKPKESVKSMKKKLSCRDLAQLKKKYMDNLTRDIFANL